MSAFDKTAQGTAVLEASGNAGAEAPDGQARCAVGEIPSLRAAQQGEICGQSATSEVAPSHTTGGAVCCCRPLGCVVPVLLDAGQASWVVLLGAGQLQGAGFLRRRIHGREILPARANYVIDLGLQNTLSLPSPIDVTPIINIVWETHARGLLRRIRFFAPKTYTFVLFPDTGISVYRARGRSQGAGIWWLPTALSNEMKGSHLPKFLKLCFFDRDACMRFQKIHIAVGGVQRDIRAQLGVCRPFWVRNHHIEGRGVVFICHPAHLSFLFECVYIETRKQVH